MLKILVIAPAWVGDVVMSQTLFKQLKSQYAENCLIDVLVNDWAIDVVKRMPEVNLVHSNPFKHGELGLLKRLKLGWSLRKYKYTHAYVLPNSLKSALVPFFAAIPKRIGFIGEMRYGLLNQIYRLDTKALPRMVERFCALANHGKAPRQIVNPSLASDKVNQAKVLANLGLTLGQPVVCLCPAAEYGPAKRWPAEHFASLASQLQQQNYQVWLLGSTKDQLLAEMIVKHAELKDSLHNLCGRTNLLEVVDLLACAQVVVSNDSGLMHIACAVGVAVIAIYGSSSPNFTPPLTPKAKITQLTLKCSPCFARTCKFGHYLCLQQITPAMILAQITASS